MNQHSTGIAALRMNAIQPFHVMAILAEAKRLEGLGHSIIHMEVGEPDFPTPSPIIAAGIQALQQGLTKYTAAQGIIPLRQAIADFYANKFAVMCSCCIGIFRKVVSIRGFFCSGSISFCRWH